MTPRSMMFVARSALLRTSRVAAAIAAVLAVFGLSIAHAAEAVRHHASSLVGPVKHGPDFKHFDWVNPAAPKGGVVREFARGSFDSLNGFTKDGKPVTGLGLIYDQLFADSPDEPTAQYGLLAEWMSYPDDFSSVTFGLRQGAKFHDGEAIKPEDVIFSMDALKEAHPRYKFYYANVVKGEKTGEREVTFTFDSKGNRELPHIVAQLSVVPKHFWTANGPDGKPRSITSGSLELPLGSGPYKVKSLEPGRDIAYERVKDYWAKDLPVMLGQWNFDEIRFTYYRDQTPAFEDFKAGKIDHWAENRASAWATQYDFPALKKGLVKKEELPQSRLANMQVFAFNLRRPKFADIRTRRAFNLAFNFEETNSKLFYGSYIRTSSFFDNSELKATALPTGRELEILNEAKAVPNGVMPAELFTTPYTNPVNTPDKRRANLSEATKLLAAAGWTNKNGTLVNASAEEFTVEFLINQENWQKLILPYVEDLKLLGIKAVVRLVDSSQYQKREDDRDFDIVVDSPSQSVSPGNEQRDFWGSEAAKMNGSRNVPGIANPAIDHIVDKVVFAKDRAELIAATRALDRVLLWNAYVVPQWNYPFERIATWDMFGRPAKLPSQVASILQTWWIDPAKQAALTAAKGN